MKKLSISTFLFICLSALCSAKSDKTTVGVYAMQLTATRLESGVSYIDGLTRYLVASLVMDGDTLTVVSDYPGHFDFGEIKPGKAELIIDDRPDDTDKFERYSEMLEFLPGDNIVFAEIKAKGDIDDLVLPIIGVTSDDVKQQPMPLSLQEDGLHYSVYTILLKMKQNETYDRLKSFPGIVVNDEDAEIIFPLDNIGYSRINDTLVVSYAGED